MTRWTIDYDLLLSKNDKSKIWNKNWNQTCSNWIMTSHVKGGKIKVETKIVLNCKLETPLGGVSWWHHKERGRRPSRKWQNNILWRRNISSFQMWHFVILLHLFIPMPCKVPIEDSRRRISMCLEHLPVRLEHPPMSPLSLSLSRISMELEWVFWCPSIYWDSLSSDTLLSAPPPQTLYRRANKHNL